MLYERILIINPDKHETSELKILYKGEKLEGVIASIKARIVYEEKDKEAMRIVRLLKKDFKVSNAKEFKHK